MSYPYQEYTIEERLNLTKKIKSKYPGCIPILIDIPGKVVFRAKYLVPGMAPLSQVLHSIRQENKLNEYEGVFLFTNNYLLTMSQSVFEVYSRHANRDGFLYMVVTFENTFGAKIY